MKHSFFKLILALLLFVKVGEVSAQKNCTVSGVTITASGSTTDFYGPTTYTGPSCTSTPFTGSAAWTDNTSNTGTVTYTFSTPIVSANISYNSVDFGATTVQDIGTLSINGGGTLALSNLCNVTAAGNVIRGIFSATTAAGNVSLTVSSTMPFTTITITNTGGKTGWVQGNPCDFTFTLPCVAGSPAPTLGSNTTKTNVCPATTADLTTGLVTSTAPAGTSIKWFTNNTHTTAVADATQAPAGTYYAFYYNPSNDCYSLPSAAVTVTVTACCPTEKPNLKQ